MRTEAAWKGLEESAEDICKKVGIRTEMVHQLDSNLPLDKQALLGMVANYGMAEDDLAMEVHQLNWLIARKKDKGLEVSTPLKLSTMLEPYKGVFMDLHKLVCIAVTLPVTSAACKRSFSCLKLLKIYLCNSSGNNCTSNLAIMSVNSRNAKQLDIDTVTDTFAANHQNKCIVLM